jgi:hypothetical protein
VAAERAVAERAAVERVGAERAAAKTAAAERVAAERAAAKTAVAERAVAERAAAERAVAETAAAARAAAERAAKAPLKPCSPPQWRSSPPQVALRGAIAVEMSAESTTLRGCTTTDDPTHAGRSRCN